MKPLRGLLGDDSPAGTRARRPKEWRCCPLDPLDMAPYGTQKLAKTKLATAYLSA